MQLIDRDKLKTAICIACSNGVIQIEGCESNDCAIQRLIDEQPEFDVRPSHYADWKFVTEDEFGRVYCCSNCRAVVTTETWETPIDAERFFCSRCGSIMNKRKRKPRRPKVGGGEKHAAD